MLGRESLLVIFLGARVYPAHNADRQPRQIMRFRDRIGEEGCEYKLVLTVEAGIATQMITKASLMEANVDTTVRQSDCLSDGCQVVSQSKKCSGEAGQADADFFTSKL